jgi:peptidoglycan/xylan/chitin deacetylase (PgdA/CDA1 family)
MLAAPGGIRPLSPSTRNPDRAREVHFAMLGTGRLSRQHNDAMTGSMSVAGRIAAIGVPLAVVVSILLLATELQEGPAPVSIRVNGDVVQVDAGTTFGDLVRSEDLHAGSGRLLDVAGGVLQRRADPGEVLVNGARASRSRPLQRGDEVVVVDGRDRTEATTRVVTMLADPVPQNPESLLGTAPAEEITIQGKRSGIIVRQFTRATERVHRPDAVALTFDDGPWPTATDRILDILRRHDAPASFFVVGYLAARYPALVQRELRAGMTVGNHSWSHPLHPAFRNLQDSRMREEMLRPQSIIEGAGAPAGLFRPPGGSWDDGVRTTASGLGMRLVLWDIDTLDWRSSTTPNEITKTVLSRVRPGSIVLMHDGGGDARQTIAALPDIIKGIRKRGLKLVAL